MAKQTVEYQYQGTLLYGKKEKLLIHYNQDAPPENCPDLKKPIPIGYILYDSTYI